MTSNKNDRIALTAVEARRATVAEQMLIAAETTHRQAQGQINAVYSDILKRANIVPGDDQIWALEDDETGVFLKKMPPPSKS